MRLRWTPLLRRAHPCNAVCTLKLTKPPRSTIWMNVKPLAWSQTTASAAFSTSTYKSKKGDQLPPRPTLPDSDIKHVYLKGSGPGGQKINKTSSAVQLTHLPTGLVVKSQATRSRTQNHTIAKRILAEKIELMEKGPESRVAKKIERLQRKKASSGKKTRRKYRKLEEEEKKERQGVADAEEELDGEAWGDATDNQDLNGTGMREERKDMTESSIAPVRSR